MNRDQSSDRCAAASQDGRRCVWPLTHSGCHTWEDKPLDEQDRFSIHWDRSMGCYRVSVPELSMAGERVDVVRVGALEAKLAEMELHDDLPDSHDLGYMAAWREIRAWISGASDEGQAS